MGGWNLVVRLVLALYALAVVAWLSLAVTPPGWLLQVLPSVPGLSEMTPPPPDLPSAQPAWQDAVEFVFSGLNVALALLLVTRRPDAPVPRLLGVALLGTAATFNLPAHRVFHLLGSPWPISAAHFVMHIASGLAYAWAVIVFPDGHLPRGRRLTRARAVAVVGATSFVAAYISWRGSFLDHPQFFVVFFGALVPLIGVTAQTLRLSDPDAGPRERATARLLVAALLPAAAVAVLWGVTAAHDAWRAESTGAAFSGNASDAVAALFPAVFAVVPIVLVAGVARYRLWDIDRLVSGVLVYGVLALGLGAAYVVAVVTSGWLAGSGTWWTVLVLAVTAVAVEPLRQRGRRWANRVVFGQVLSPSDALRNLATGLEQMTPSGGMDQVVEVVVRATRATRAELWLLDGPRLVRAAVAPVPQPEATPDVGLEVAATSATEVLRDRGMTASWPVAYRGETLGHLAVVAPDGGLGAHGADLVESIASHAGLLVHNALLAVHLRQDVADLATQSSALRVARRRLVAAQQAERLRMERDLHDGAQQSLVAAILGLRLLAPSSLSSRDLERAVGEVRDLLGGAGREMEGLLAGGPPAELTELGLVGAVTRATDVARRSGHEVSLEVVDDLSDLGTDVATALYLCCLECLSNIAKHARATRVEVALSRDDDVVRLGVRDDGIGFEGSALESGGLHHLSQRLIVLGGELTVRTQPGRGTITQAWLPLHPSTSPGVRSAS